MEKTSVDCVVVGAGLAGLRAALDLTRAGHSVHVIEAEDAVGGRARTVWHEGLPVDRGFQTVFAAYPETRRFIRDVGIPDGDLRPFGRSAVYVDGAEVNELGLTERLRPKMALLSMDDLALLTRLVARVRFASPARLLADDSLSARDFLMQRGFSRAFIERVVGPLFGPISLDPSLSMDSGYFRFLVSMMVRGAAVLPSDGVGMIAEWAAAALRAADVSIETGVRVDRLALDGNGRRVEAVELSDGRRLTPKTTVLAVDPPAAARLLKKIEPRAESQVPADGASSINVAFALSRSLYDRKTVILNAARREARRARVDLLCQTSNVSRAGRPEGPHIVLATIITTGAPEIVDDTAVDLVGRFVAGAAPGFKWDDLARPIGVYRHRYALPRPLPSARTNWPTAGTRVENLALAGDYLQHPSIEGAVVSGGRAARVAAGALARG